MLLNLILVTIISCSVLSEDKIKIPKHKCLSGPTTTKKIQHHLAECEEEVKIHLLKEAFYIVHKEHHPYPHTADHHVLEHSPHFHHTSDLEHPSLHHPSFYRSAKLHLHQPPNNLNSFNFDTQSFHHPDDQLIPEHLVDSIHSESNTQIKHSEPYVHHPNSHLPESFHTPKESELRHEPYNHRQKRYADYFEYPQSYHQTTLSFEDKRIAGCLLQCVYRKNHAVDSNGWPTLDGLVNFYSDGVHDHDFFIAVLKASGSCLNDGAYKYSIHRGLKPLHGEHCDLSFDVFDCISDKIVDFCSEDDYHNDHHHKEHHHDDHHKENHHDDQHHEDHHNDEHHKCSDRDYERHDDHLDHYNHEILFKYI